jgi:hypothetical protein
MARPNKRKPAPALAGNGLPKSDRRRGTIKTTRTNKRAPAQRRFFQLQSFRVLSHPEEVIRALVDPRLVGLFRRVMRGQHDCAICQTALNLDPTSVSSPGVVGFLHGNLGDEVDAVAVAACVACTLKLGDEGASRALCQEFADSCCGGGTVELVQGGTA